MTHVLFKPWQKGIDDAVIRGHQLIAGRHKSNRKLNNYADILPDDRKIPYLASPFKQSTYFNATLFDDWLGDNGQPVPKVYIASSGPNTNSINQFWHMVWERGVEVVVMLTKLQENGRIKCAQYYPTLQASVKAVAQNDNGKSIKIECLSETPITSDDNKNIIGVTRCFNIKLFDAKNGNFL